MSQEQLKVRRRLGLTALVALVLFGVGASAEAVMIRDDDKVSPEEQDIQSVEVTAQPTNPEDPHGNQNVTIKVCLTKCPTEAPTSVVVSIGGAQIRVRRAASGSWTYDRWKAGGSSWTENAGSPVWSDTAPETIVTDGGKVEKTFPCCITITETASNLGLPNGPVKVGFSATTYAANDGTTNPVDTASGGILEY